MALSVVRNLKSVLELLFSIYLLSLVLFLIFSLVPFSPLAHLLTSFSSLGPRAAMSPHTQALLESQWGLTEPFFSRFLTFHADLVKGTLGRSVWTGRSVLPLVLSRSWPSLLLAGLSFILVGFLSLVGTAVELQTRRPLLKIFFSWQGMILLCTPPFALAVWLRQTFFGASPFPMALLVYVLALLPYFSSLVTAKLKEELQKAYVRTALAQGSHLTRLLTRTLLKPALGILFSYLPAGWSIFWATSLVVEPLLRIPGVGLLTFEAYHNQDGPLLLGIAFCVGMGRLILGWLRDELGTPLLIPSLSSDSQ